ncbi:MAG: hypothetical protein Ct9H300mP10_08230 [Methanobacteriota archaeon]|nr:MAG: hypothetical protein Ct9H300mP10_08230 [Euryarchaeota archaeon]
MTATHTAEWSTIGSAHDGQLAGIYPTDEWPSGTKEDMSTGSRSGTLHQRMELRGTRRGHQGMAEGQVTKANRPFSSWYYEIDMSNREEGD